MTSVAPLLAAIDTNLPDSLDRLFALLRFKSVGTDPQFNGECREAAGWLKRQLEGMGFTAELRETTGQPLVVARWQQSGSVRPVPHVLFYGHYDVQPADPLDLWDSPPFEPVIRTDKSGQKQIFARGASDDKGQLMTFLEACRAWLSMHGSLPFNLTVLLEGDEEGDSEHLDRFLQANRKEFKADAAWVCDTHMWGERTPAITTLLRGCISEEVILSGPTIDLHSGYYGGPVVNPCHVLSRVMADLHDDSGRVRIPHFYDGVKPVPDPIRKRWAGLKFNSQKFLADVGVSIPAGEQGYSVLEQLWARPTAECNGLLGGYAGAGSKTVLPSKAMAKFTFRLVKGQKPSAIRKAFHAFVKARLPRDCKVSFISMDGESTGIGVAEDNPWIDAARRALKAEWGRDAVLIGDGGSIPVVESFKRHQKLDSLLIGFALQCDGMHSPNEKYNLESFRRGIRSWVRVIAETQKQEKP